MRDEKLQEILEPAVASAGYILWGIEYSSRKSRDLLRVYIDHANGVTVSDCEKASRQISAVLDVEDAISSAYDLEVSSPGIDRKFFKLEQYNGYVNHKLKIKLWAPISNMRNLKCVLISVNMEEQKISVLPKQDLSVDDKPEELFYEEDDLIDISITQIKQAKLLIDDNILIS